MQEDFNSKGMINISCMCACSSHCHVRLMCNPVDCGPPGSSVHGIFLARIREWVAISFSLKFTLIIYFNSVLSFQHVALKQLMRPTVVSILDSAALDSSNLPHFWRRM